MKRLLGTFRVLIVVFALVGIALATRDIAHARTPGYQSLLPLAHFFTSTAIVLLLARVAIARRIAETPPADEHSSDS